MTPRIMQLCVDQPICQYKNIQTFMLTYLTPDERRLRDRTAQGNRLKPILARNLGKEKPLNSTFLQFRSQVIIEQKEKTDKKPPRLSQSVYRLVKASCLIRMIYWVCCEQCMILTS